MSSTPTEVRKEDGTLTHKMCCICFKMVEVEKLWKCRHDVKWDMCGACGYKEGCLCPPPQQPVVE